MLVRDPAGDEGGDKPSRKLPWRANELPHCGNLLASDGSNTPGALVCRPLRDTSTAAAEANSSTGSGGPEGDAFTTCLIDKPAGLEQSLARTSLSVYGKTATAPAQPC